ncbi:MAG: hypothetical protein ACP5I1_11250 [Candidatus Hinthialibacter sp.]
MSVWIERSEPSLQSVVRDAPETARMQNVQICLESPRKGQNTVHIDSLHYDSKSRRFLLRQFSLSIKDGGLDDSIYELLEFASFFEQDIKAVQSDRSVKKRLIQEVGSSCVKPICEIHDFSIQTPRFTFSAEQFDLQDGDFLHFKTAFFQEITGREISITPLQSSHIRRIEAASLLWKFPIQQPVLWEGAIHYTNRKTAAFEKCVLDLPSMEILTITPPARVNTHTKLSILPGINTNLWVRKKR